MRIMKDVKRWLRPVVVMALAGIGVNGCVGLPGGPGSSAWTSRSVNTDANVRPAVMVIADVDADGKRDIVAGYAGTDTTNPAIVIFFQTDVDNFVSVQALESSDLEGVAALAVNDLDGDGHADIVAACKGLIIYLHGPADPRQAADWDSSDIVLSFGTGINQWNDIAIGDIDGINGPDIVACNANVGRLSWFKSPAANIVDGTGWTRIDIDATTRTNAASVALLDVDGDDRLDIISTAPGETSARVAWYKNPTDPVAGAWTKTTIGNLPAATRIALGDLDVDGRIDLVVTNPPGRQVGWYKQPADTSTTWSGFLLGQFSTAAPFDIKVVDVDGNSQPDVIVATQTPGSFRWFSPNGVQTNVWKENNARDISESPGPFRFDVGDIDGDGRPDVAAPIQGATTDADGIVWLENPT